MIVGAGGRGRQFDDGAGCFCCRHGAEHWRRQSNVCRRGGREADWPVEGSCARVNDLPWCDGLLISVRKLPCAELCLLDHAANGSAWHDVRGWIASAQLLGCVAAATDSEKASAFHTCVYKNTRPLHACSCPCFQIYRLGTTAELPSRCAVWHENSGQYRVLNVQLGVTYVHSEVHVSSHLS